MSDDSAAAARNTAREVLVAEARAIERIAELLDHHFDAAVDALAGCTGRVIVSGMGKSGIICRKIAATLSSTGTPAFFMHPAEALHGDLGGIVPGDVAILASHGGETDEIVRLLPLLRELTPWIIALCGRSESTLARSASIVLDVSVSAEACPHGLAPTASSTATLAMGDALAMAVMERKGFSATDFGRVHPGGKLGLQFLRVEDLMHSGTDLPMVTPSALIREVISEIAAKGLGITTVIDGDSLVGVVTDGDIRRLLERVEAPLELVVSTVMSRHPRTILPAELAANARRIMEPLDGRAITALVVIDRDGRVAGVLKSHDLAKVCR